jgi:hypothetical protein
MEGDRGAGGMSTRTDAQRLVLAAATLVAVVLLAALVRWLDSGWVGWAIVWLFAIRWILILVLDLPTPETP